MIFKRYDYLRYLLQWSVDRIGGLNKGMKPASYQEWTEYNK